MTISKDLNWPLILGLGSFALIRPLTRVIMAQIGVEPPSALPVVLTVLVTLGWVAAVSLLRTAAPVITLVLSGVVYAVLAIALSAVLSPLLDGSLAGPLANPRAILPMLLINAAWGLVAGLLALGLQQLRERWRSTPSPTR